MSLNVKLDVNPFHDDLSDCIEECIITVAAYLRRNYVLMYSKAWGFSYREKDDGSNCICKRIDADREDVFELLSHYHGISLSFYMNEDPLEALGIIKRELVKKIPVTILMDTYYYSWDPNKNRHGKHAFLVTGIDEVNKVLYCTDPYFSQINTPLEYKDFAQGYLGKLLTFSLTKSEIADFDWKNIINHTIRKLEGKSGGLSAFDSMLKFADDIENYFCMEDEIGSYDRIVDIPYYTNIQSIFRGRQQFAKVLDNIAFKYGIRDLLPVSLKLKEVSNIWNTVRGLLTKGIIASNESIVKSKVPFRIREAAHCESEVAKLLAGIVNPYCRNFISQAITKETFNEYEKDIESNEYTCLDLACYFNNKGFGSMESEKSEADLNGLGMYILEEDVPDDGFLEVDDMKFRFSKAMDGINDNISCMGQIIDVEPVYCSSIMILGTADFGSFKETVTITYSDGNTYNISAGFTEYIFSPVYGEVVAWEGRACERNNGKLQILNCSVKIFAKTYRLNKAGIIKQIALPFLPNIHIFTITLR